MTKNTAKTETGFLQIESLIPATGEVERGFKWASELVAKTKGVKPITIVPLIQQTGKSKNCNGWFIATKWKCNTDKISRAEVTLVAELMNRKPIDIMATIIHETVHVYNHAEGIKDCATNGRHNKKFQKSAELFNLICAEPIDSIGWGYTKPDETLIKAINTSFKPDATKWNLYRKPDVPGEKKPSKTKAYVCGCDTKVRASTGIDFKAECLNCNTQFEPVQEDSQE